MTPEEIHKILIDILSENPVIPWWVYILFLVLPLIGTYLGSYVSKRLENLATKQDIEDITAITKNIESRISFSNWTKQRLWELKRQIYTELIKYFYDLIKQTELHYGYPGQESAPHQPTGEPELMFGPSDFTAGKELLYKICDYKAIADIALLPEVNEIISNLSMLYDSHMGFPPAEYLIKKSNETRHAYERVLELAKQDLEIK